MLADGPHAIGVREHHLWPAGSSLLLGRAVASAKRKFNISAASEIGTGSFDVHMDDMKTVERLGLADACGVFGFCDVFFPMETFIVQDPETSLQPLCSLDHATVVGAPASTFRRDLSQDIKKGAAEQVQEW